MGPLATSSKRLMTNNAATITAPTGGNVAPTNMPATAGSDGTLKDRPHHAFDTVGGQQCSAGRIRGRMAL